MMNLLKWFSVLAMVYESLIFMLNLHEVMFDEHIVDDLIHLDYMLS